MSRYLQRDGGTDFSNFRFLTRWLTRSTIRATVTCALALPATASCAESVDVPITANTWRASGKATFSVPEGFPNGMLQIESGSAVFDGRPFANGTLEFDIKPAASGITGIRFRERDKDNADVLYIRPGADCAASDDCLQYMPVSHGAFEWDLFPEYQTRAPIRPGEWNHVRMVVSGRRMEVFINRGAMPTLVVGNLEGGAASGAIRFSGKSSFANLTVAPDEVGGLASTPTVDATAADPNYLRHWVTAAPTMIVRPASDAEREVPASALELSAMPSRTVAWSTISAGRRGLLDLSRRFGSAAEGATVSVAWLRTTIRSDRDQTKRVAVGWAREIRVYANGAQVFTDRNRYGDPKLQKAPDGRAALTNGTFDLPLKKGDNEITVALDDNFFGGNHFGWGMEMRLADRDGLHWRE